MTRSPVRGARRTSKRNKDEEKEERKEVGLGREGMTTDRESLPLT
jgi:hypothetical protein